MTVSRSSDVVDKKKRPRAEYQSDGAAPRQGAQTSGVDSSGREHRAVPDLPSANSIRGREARHLMVALGEVHLPADAAEICC